LQVSPDSQSVAISPQGTVVVDGEETGSRLLLVTFPDPTGLEKDGHLLLRARPEAGRPQLSGSTLQPETIEASNASAVKGMTDLVTTTRQFEMLTRVIEAFSAADKRAATGIMGNT
jgi:flagellar basal body rod protein FlgG